ncbi:hypothetical protein [Lacrimispora sp.]|jgi:hypothetical protein|uniref:hypothetical protein n=1 Tax=Lacrimispora sp. TaxID=2719234 RepID=UPI0026A244A8|nr:hypothetical protein [Lacrimispora sp.]
MEALKELIERRKEVGEKPSYTKGGDYNDFIEYGRLGDLIIEEVCRMYDTGELN